MWADGDHLQYEGHHSCTNAASMLDGVSRGVLLYLMTLATQDLCDMTTLSLRMHSDKSQSSA
jgi:hypothetical protein